LAGWIHPNDGRVVSNFIVQALRGEPITLYGDGGQTRSFCYVEDLIDGLIRLMNTEGPTLHQPVNIGNPHEVTVAELAERVLKLSGSASTLEYHPLPADDPMQRCPDITRASTLLGWQPRVPLEEGLARTIQYFRSVLCLETRGAGDIVTPLRAK
jgi:UDP-glucuronate decarboxylase